MIISMTVAVGVNGQIGLNNNLPWHNSEDLKLFKKRTTGHHVLMGRKTFESLPKPLPNRTHLVISRNPEYQKEGAITFPSVEEAIAFAKAKEEEELFIIGGASIYEATFHLADRIFLSRIDYDGEADRYFPEIDHKMWQLENSEQLETFLLETWYRV